MNAEQITDAAMELADKVQAAGNAIEQAATAIRELRAKATDLAAEPDMESTKREFISACDDMAALAEASASLLRWGPMQATDVKDEINGMLQNGLELFLSANQSTFPREFEADLRDLMLERARNIAQAYQGRVLREGK